MEQNIESRNRLAQTQPTEASVNSLGEKMIWSMNGVRTIEYLYGRMNFKI